MGKLEELEAAERRLEETFGAVRSAENEFEEYEEAKVRLEEIAETSGDEFAAAALREAANAFHWEGVRMLDRAERVFAVKAAAGALVGTALAAGMSPARIVRSVRGIVRRADRLPLTD